MREDMAKVIVERPRVGGRPPPKGRAVALEELPQQEGMRRRHRSFLGRKELNENLNPQPARREGAAARPTTSEVSSRDGGSLRWLARMRGSRSWRFSASMTPAGSSSTCAAASSPQRITSLPRGR